MAQVKNFGLRGVNADVQYGKGGGRIQWATDHFSVLNAAGGAAQVRVATAPADENDAASKSYVDSVAAGLDPKASVRAATTANVGTGFTAGGGVAGEGDTITGVGATLTVDGVALANGDRVLVRAQTTATQNGIYVYDGADNLVRANDFDGSPENEVDGGEFTFVEEGSLYADTGWVLSTDAPITFNTTPLNFTQFSAAGVISAGDGLTKTGQTIDVGDSATIGVDADSVFVNSSGTQNQILLSSGTAGQASTFGALPLADGNATSGILPNSRGGLGADASGFADNSLLAKSGTGYAAVALGAANTVLTSTGTGLTYTLPQTLYQDGGAAAISVDATTGTVTLAVEGTAAGHLVTKAYVDGAVNTSSGDLQTELDTTQASVGLAADGNLVDWDVAAVYLSSGDTTIKAAIETLDAVAGDIQDELDATQTGAGLGVEGAYTADAGTTYLTGATSLFNADVLLDTALAAIDGRVDTLETNTGNLQTELDATQAGAGLEPNGTLAAWTTPTYLTATENSLKLGIEKLDDELATLAATVGNVNVVGTTGEITVAEAGGTYTVSIDDTYTGQASITTVGTIGSGTWQGTSIGAVYGGTGKAAADLTAATSGQILRLNATNNGYDFADLSAAIVTYDNTTSALTATTVQDAIDEVEGRSDNTQASVGLNADGTKPAYTSLNYILAADPVVTAINKLDTALDATDARMDTGFANAGLGTDGSLADWLSTNYLSNADDNTLKEAIEALDTALSTVEGSVTAMGSAFNYVGTLDATTQANLDALAEQDAGDYYKVSVGGTFTWNTGTVDEASITANANDGIVRNTAGGWDLIDNTNSTVAGTAGRIDVDGSPDTGYTVNIDTGYVGQASITTLGTIGTGTWQATEIGTGYGGTGLTTLGTAGQILRVNGDATGYEFGDLSAANVSYSNGTSGLTATTTQGAIDEVEGRVGTLESDLSNLSQSRIEDTDGNTYVDVEATADNNQVQIGAAGQLLGTFTQGTGDNNFVFTNAATEVRLEAAGTGPDVDIRLVPMGAGQVFIGEAAQDGTIQADNDRNLNLLGGDAVTLNGNGGNVAIGGGAANGTGNQGSVTITGDQITLTTANTVSVPNTYTPTGDFDLVHKGYVDSEVTTAIGDLAVDNLVSDDGNSTMIVDGVSVGTTGVNHAQISNAATGTAVIYGAAGGDANIDIQLTPAGTGLVVASGTYDMSAGGAKAFTTKDYVDARADAEFLLATADANLPNALVASGGNGITFTAASGEFAADVDGTTIRATGGTGAQLAVSGGTANEVLFSQGAGTDADWGYVSDLREGTGGASVVDATGTGGAGLTVNSDAADNVSITGKGGANISITLNPLGTGFVVAPNGYDMSTAGAEAFTTKGYVDNAVDTAVTGGQAGGVRSVTAAFTATGGAVNLGDQIQGRVFRVTVHITTAFDGEISVGQTTDTDQLMVGTEIDETGGASVSDVNVDYTGALTQLVADTTGTTAGAGYAIIEYVSV